MLIVHYIHHIGSNDMSQMTETTQKTEDNNPLITGLVLIALGAVFLIAQFVEMHTLFFFVPAAFFLGAGIIKREAGFFIPAGILAGIGLGVSAMEWDWFSTYDEGGVFMFAFALGWFSIPMMSALFTAENNMWALIPGGIMALIGAAVIGGGIFEQTLEMLGQYWPVILIAVGLGILVNGARRKTSEPTV